MAGKNRTDIDETPRIGVKIKRTALMLNSCERTIRRHLDSGLLEGFYFGGSRLVTADSIEKLRNSSKKAT